MIDVSSELGALLDSGAFARADLYRIAPVGRPAVFWTSADVDLEVEGDLYRAGDARFERGRLTLARGLEVDSLDLSILVDSAVEPTVNGVPLRQAAQKGLLDGATVELDWCYLSGWGPPPAVVGRLRRFAGRAGAIAVSRGGVRMTVNSWLVLLDANVPAKIYTGSCRFTLGDVGCGVDLTRHGRVGVVGDGATTLAIPCDLGEDDGAFDSGWVAFGDGVCAGVTRAIRHQTVGVLALAAPLPWAPAAGDTFTLYPGCDKTMPTAACPATCQGRYANAARFGGMPFIPVPETAY